MIEVREKPLVTFFVIAYKQERFIREAVEGAFAQTYSPLEIILSDDCSPDKTYDIMRQMAAAYCGPHRLVLNRNPSNLGIAQHVNRIVSLSSGTWLVAAAGDDASLPRRVELLFHAWAADGCRARSIYSNMRVVDSGGREMFVQWEKGEVTHAKGLEEAVRRCSIGIAGCAHAFSRCTFDLFGPINGNGMVEDQVIGFRSLLLAPILYIPEPLVRYREHGRNVKHGDRLKMCRFAQLFLRTWLQDLGRAEQLQLITQDRIAFVRSRIQRELDGRIAESQLLQGNVISTVFTAARMLGSKPDLRLVAKALYRGRAPFVVKRIHKLLAYDMFHPRDLFKSLVHASRR